MYDWCDWLDGMKGYVGGVAGISKIIDFICLSVAKYDGSALGRLSVA